MAREVLHNKFIERCAMVGIDGKVINIYKKILSEWGRYLALSDKYFELIIADVHKWIRKTKKLFDVIILDILDPI